MSTADLTSLSRGGGSGGSNTAISTSARGYVVVAPADDDSTLMVIVPDFSPSFPYEVPPAQWTHGQNLPARGTAVLATFDDKGDVWVPLWDGMQPGGGGSGGNVDGGTPESVYGGTTPVDGGSV